MVALEVADLQGEWIASRGEAVQVTGSELRINGIPVPGGLLLNDDGKVVGFGIYKLYTDDLSSDIEWRAGPQELSWRRGAKGEVTKKVRELTEILTDLSDPDSEKAAVVRMNSLLDRWRIGLEYIRSCNVVPDATNRAQTGLSIHHVHYIASQIAEHGFKSRRRGLCTSDGAHDVPVLVMERGCSELGSRALAKWSATVKETNLPNLVDPRSFYCSLGNGHFSQALNLFRARGVSLFSGEQFVPDKDAALVEALQDGVQSLVLSSEMPAADRKFVSDMLNKAHGRPWVVQPNGHVSVQEASVGGGDGQFVALSKVLDAEELSCLVRSKLGFDKASFISKL
mmetsp:Transcript_91146/g.244019  ORF Transcript_91146/g.244019 Transcript_91146/m.244019 type:complete len:340 (-) Transcript_91146:223-1242(-)